MVNHPIAYALVAVFAVGFVVYEYFSHKQKHGHRNGRSRSPPRRFDHDFKPDKPDNKPKTPDYKPDNRPRKPDDKPDNPDDKPGKPIGKPDDKSKQTTGKPSDKPAKEIDSYSKSNSSPTSSNENSVCRYRKPHSERLNESKQEDDNTTVLKMKDTPPREQDQKVSHSKETRPTSSGFIKNEVQSSSFNDVSNQKMDEKNYEKNVFDRLNNETKCINKDPKEEVKLSNNNILEDSKSDSESDYESDSDNGPTLNDYIDRMLQQAACPAEDSQNKKNQEKEDEMKEAYKQEVANKFKRDIEDGCEDTASGGDTFDDLDIEKVRSRISNNMQQKKCSGCEERPCDAVVLPCEHCYLCKDCAKFVVECSPKCSICLADINDFR